MADQTITCKDCGADFVFTEAEQEFYREKGFENEPVRCQSCRQARKRERGSNRGPRTMYPAVCAECGKDTEVPFQPSDNRPVYCRDCYRPSNR